MKRLVLIFAALFAPMQAFAATTYYVDSAYTGTHSGSPSQPWSNLSNSGAWNTINMALGSGTVTVYFSARNASTDTDQGETARILLDRTDLGTNLLLLDANTQYNSDSVNPSSMTWMAYAGSSRHAVTNSDIVTTDNNVSPFPVRQYITVQGFRFNVTNGKCSIIEAAVYVTFNNNICTGSVGTMTVGPMNIAGGPGTLSGGVWTLGPNNDHVTYSNNVISNSFGECIYIAGNIDGQDPPGVNRANSTNTTISGNTLVDCGTGGAAGGQSQGDAIDVKDGNCGVVINGNTIYNTGAGGPSGDGQGITMEVAATVYGNFIHDVQRSGIKYGQAYNNTFCRTGGMARNNVIINNQNNAGIFVTSQGNPLYEYSGLGIYNNTVYSPKDGAIIVNNAQDIIVENNIFSVFNTNPFAATYQTAALGSHNNNSYRKAAGSSYILADSTTYTNANLTSFESGSISADPLFVSTATPYVVTNFKLQGGSPALSPAGLNLTSIFTDDFDGNTRANTNFQMGAYGGTAGACTPAKVAIITQPSDAILNASIGTITAWIEDASNTLCSSATNSVSVAKNGSATWGALAGTTPKSAVAGVVQFTDLTVTTSVGSGAIDLASSGLTGATTNSINITSPCVPAKLLYSAQPVGAQLGATLGTVSVGVYDASNVLCNTATNSITLSKNASATWDPLASSSSLTKSASSGVATWTDLSVTTTIGSGKIDASASGLTGASSNSITITGTPALISINVPSGAQGTVVSVVLTGTSLSSAAVCTISVSGSGVTASNTACPDNTHITGLLTITPTAATGARNLTVTTDNGTSNALTFTVNAAIVGSGAGHLRGRH